MPIREIEIQLAEKALRDYCAYKTNPAFRDQLEFVFRREGNFAYLSERRPDWKNPKIIHDHDVAKFRFFVNRRAWRLYWCDRNLRWHLFDELEPAMNIKDLLPMVDSHPIFFG